MIDDYHKSCSEENSKRDFEFKAKLKINYLSYLSPLLKKHFLVKTHFEIIDVRASLTLKTQLIFFCLI